MAGTNTHGDSGTAEAGGVLGFRVRQGLKPTACADLHAISHRI